MLLRSLARRPAIHRMRLAQMTAHLSNGAMNGTNGTSNGSSSSHSSGVTLNDLPKSNVFTSSLPPDPTFPTPAASHKAPRRSLGPRMVKGALYTYVRPEESKEPELLAVSERAMKDIGLKPGEEKTEEFKQLVAGNKFFWDEESGEGIYPWAQCYGGWQFGSWAGQLGDGRAISLFEATNPETKVRYEIQLKGAGKTPYSRFADGKAVLRSSIREFIVSEALNALNIPSTRALALTLLPHEKVRRERLEPGAIVTRFAQSWLRIGTFDILRARGNRDLIRQVSTYIAEKVFDGWSSLPAALPADTDIITSAVNPSRGVAETELQGAEGAEENRFTRLYREIVRRNAKMVAAWQAYAFTNGVLNTDNTSIFGLSIDFGPFAFLDNFDPNYTPNHDDHMLRYSYRNQPSIIWWNLIRLGESLGELIGGGSHVDDEEFISKGVSKDFAPELIKRAETIITAVGEEYKAVFMAEYKRLMTARLGLKSHKTNESNNNNTNNDNDNDDDESLYSDLLDTMQTLELDFNQFFRKLSSLHTSALDTDEKRKDAAALFFHHEGVTGIGNTDANARARVAKWLDAWRARVLEDWGADGDEERQKAMKMVNPKFIPKSWILDELIQRVETGGEREILQRVLHMALNPFEDRWGWDEAEEERFCGDVPRQGRAMQCSCSS